MIVYSDGSIAGTIGGGNLENLVIGECLKLFESEENCLLKTFQLVEEGENSTNMYCGGEAKIFLELVEPAERLLVFGGGHICQALTKIFQELNFSIIVVDSRQEILNNYSHSVSTILTNSDYTENYPDLRASDYIIIVTHGHKYDSQVLRKVVGQQSVYIGMIGSKRKIGKTFEDLVKTGVRESDLKKVKTPIGLNIGAEGPHEIAISIAAELIAVRRNKSIEAGW